MVKEAPGGLRHFFHLSWYLSDSLVSSDVRNTSRALSFFMFTNPIQISNLGRSIEYLTTLFRKFEGSFWGLSGLFGGAWERCWKENWGKIVGENPSEVINETS